MRRSVPDENIINIDLGFAATCWEIWKERKRRIFDNRQVRYDILGETILDTVSFWKSVLVSSSNRYNRTVLIVGRCVSLFLPIRCGCALILILSLLAPAVK
uniref:Uncharacterized protein n=1 Tax=Ananas comosus var. bracteatus TaxID=296719 RepID=A0A6V7PKE0_ANACO|nr:unnamed protein product [Ananas comosus var. bracteatus]